MTGGRMTAVGLAALVCGAAVAALARSSDMEDATVDGTLMLQSPKGRRTRLHAEIPYRPLDR